MKAIAAALLLSIAASGPTFAITRYNSLSLTCAAAQQAIARERSVLLRYPSDRGNIILYDRYVSDAGLCGAGNYASRTSVPTKDNPSCPVYNCKSSSVFNPR